MPLLATRGLGEMQSKATKPGAVEFFALQHPFFFFRPGGFSRARALLGRLVLKNHIHVQIADRTVLLSIILSRCSRTRENPTPQAPTSSSSPPLCVLAPTSAVGGPHNGPDALLRDFKA